MNRFIWYNTNVVKKMFVLISVMSAFSCVPKQDPPGPHLWAGSEIGFYLNEEANQLSETVIRESFQRWGKATHFTFVYKGRHRAGLRKDGKNTVSFLVRRPEEVPIDKTAWCRKWYYRDGNIVEADIILNQQIARFTTLRTNKPDSYFLEGVIVHEIGHLLGLSHSALETSVMKSFSPVEESYFRGEIDDDTLEKYRNLYESEH